MFIHNIFGVNLWIPAACRWYYNFSISSKTHCSYILTKQTFHTSFDWGFISEFAFFWLTFRRSSFQLPIRTLLLKRCSIRQPGTWSFFSMSVQFWQIKNTVTVKLLTVTVYVCFYFFIIGEIKTHATHSISV